MFPTQFRFDFCVYKIQYSTIFYVFYFTNVRGFHPAYFYCTTDRGHINLQNTIYVYLILAKCFMSGKFYKWKMSLKFLTKTRKIYKNLHSLNFQTEISFFRHTFLRIYINLWVIKNMIFLFKKNHRACWEGMKCQIFARIVTTCAKLLHRFIWSIIRRYSM